MYSNSIETILWLTIPKQEILGRYLLIVHVNSIFKNDVFIILFDVIDSECHRRLVWSIA